MNFYTKVAGIPCKCVVNSYIPSISDTHGQFPEDSSPGDPSIFEFVLADRNGRPAPWLEKLLSPADIERLEEEFLLMMEAEYQLMD